MSIVGPYASERRVRISRTRRDIRGPSDPTSDFRETRRRGRGKYSTHRECAPRVFPRALHISPVNFGRDLSRGGFPRQFPEDTTLTATRARELSDAINSLPNKENILSRLTGWRVLLSTRGEGKGTEVAESSGQISRPVLGGSCREMRYN